MNIYFEFTDKKMIVYIGGQCCVSIHKINGTLLDMGALFPPPPDELRKSTKENVIQPVDNAFFVESILKPDIICILKLLLYVLFRD